MMVFQWRDGSRFPVKAQAAGERLAEIQESNGGHLTPSMVVEDSRPEGAPLHPCFEWDDPVAAERYREDQARRLIRSVYVVHEAADGAESKTLGYVHVDLQDDGPAYVTTARAMSDDDLREQAIGDALSGLRAWQRRYEHLAELQPIFQAIEAAVARTERRRVRKERAAAHATA